MEAFLIVILVGAASSAVGYLFVSLREKRHSAELAKVRQAYSDFFAEVDKELERKDSSEYADDKQTASA